MAAERSAAFFLALRDVYFMMSHEASFRSAKVRKCNQSLQLSMITSQGRMLCQVAQVA
jgi:hypothetical protein